jgi:hypothetical protein
VRNVTLYSVDGESWEGKWRHARDEMGLMQISGSAGETLVGTFTPVSRQVFFERYENTFGTGAIAADGPDVSAFGNAFAGMLGGSNTLLDVAYGENWPAVLLDRQSSRRQKNDNALFFDRLGVHPPWSRQMQRHNREGLHGRVLAR